MQDFRELRVWQKAHDVALAVYQATSSFPQSESYGLTSQMRRAAVSIPSNIAEGRGAGTEGAFLRYLRVAMASAFELDYQLLLARDLGFLANSSFEDISAKLSEAKRMLGGFINALKAERANTRTPLSGRLL